MRDLVVLGHDPRFGGGGAAQTAAFLAGARAVDREPFFLYAPHPALAGRRFTTDRIEPLRHVRGARRLAPATREARSVWVVATHATAGAAAVRAGRSYACWIGTSVDDEWRGRRGGLSPIRRAAFAAGLPALRHVERSVLAAARQIYATSRASAAAVAAAGRIDPRDVSVLPIPVDVARFVPEPEEEWIARLEAPTITFVGRATDPRKNISLLLAAAPSLRRRVPGLRVRLVGEPPPGPLPPGVEAVGPVASVADELRSASLFVLPSRQEGFGIVVAEALASGVPVISTRSGGPEEILERSRAGRLLDTFDEDELVETAAALLHDVATLVEMRRRGRSYVEREHSPAVFGNLLRRALRDLDDA